MNYYRQGLSLKEPALRVAFGCHSFIDKALNNSRWASLVARMVAAAPKGGEIARRHLFENLQQFSKGLPGGKASAELNLEIVVGIMLQLLRTLGEGRMRSLDREAAVSAILRAIGLNARQTKTVLARLPAPPDDAMPGVARSLQSQRPTAASSAT